MRRRILPLLLLSTLFTPCFPAGLPAEVASLPESQPLLTARISLYQALFEAAMVSLSVTALRPAEISVGYGSSNTRETFFCHAGVSLPWYGFTSGDGTMREIFFTLGYRQSRPSPWAIFATPPPARLHSVAIILGLEATDWFSAWAGLSLLFSLGVDYRLTEYQHHSRMQPLLDISVGIAF